MPQVRFIIANRAGNKLPETLNYGIQSDAFRASILHAPCWVIKQMKESPGAKWEFLADVGYRDEKGEWFNTFTEFTQSAAQTFTTRDLAKLMQLLQETREEAHSVHRKMVPAHARDGSVNDMNMGQLKFHLREAANRLAEIHSSLN